MCEERFESEQERVKLGVFITILYFIKYNIVIDNQNIIFCCNEDCFDCFNKLSIVCDTTKNFLLQHSSTTKTINNLFNDKNFLPLFRSHSFTTIYKQQLNKINTILINKCNPENYENILSDKFFYTFFKITKSQFQLQFDYIYKSIQNYLKTNNILHCEKFQLYNELNGITTTITNSKKFIWRSLIVFIYNIVNDSKLKNSMNLGITEKTNRKYYRSGLIITYLFYDYADKYWTEHKLDETILPEHYILYPYV